MLDSPAQAYLIRTGHGSGGRCSKCWSEAATLYACGQGAYESHTSAYYAVTARYEDEALAATAPAGRM